MEKSEQCTCTERRKCNRQHPICECCGHPKDAISVHTKSMWRYVCPGITTPTHGFMCHKKMMDTIIALQTRVTQLEESTYSLTLNC